MQVLILEDVIEQSERGDKVIFHAGALQTPISLSYIPKNTKVGKYNTDISEINPEFYYIFYIWGKYITVEKEKCSVPTSIGWNANV